MVNGHGGHVWSSLDGPSWHNVNGRGAPGDGPVTDSRERRLVTKQDFQ